jgi:hypothetical protein
MPIPIWTGVDPARWLAQVCAEMRAKREREERQKDIRKEKQIDVSRPFLPRAAKYECPSSAIVTLRPFRIVFSLPPNHMTMRGSVMLVEICEHPSDEPPRCILAPDSRSCAAGQRRR